jgi:hypothetical protein
LVQFLTDRDQPCPDCSYNLRNLRGRRCPECGAELTLRVNLVEPRQRLLIAGLIGLSAGAGFNGLLIIYVIIVLIRFHGPLPPEFFPIVFTGFVVLAAIACCWLLFWRKLRRMSTSLRLILTLTCWALSLADIVIFSLTIR